VLVRQRLKKFLLLLMSLPSHVITVTQHTKNPHGSWSDGQLYSRSTV